MEKESDYFRVIISENKDFDASKGSILEIIIEVPQKPRPRRRSEVQIPLIRLATRLMLERGLGTSSWSEKHSGRAPRQTQRIAGARRTGGQGWQFDGMDRAGRELTGISLDGPQHFLLPGGSHFRIKKIRPALWQPAFERRQGV